MAAFYGSHPSGGTQHLLNGAALSHMQVSHKWAGASRGAGAEALMSHQKRFRLSGHHNKGLMGKHSRKLTISTNEETYTRG